MLSTIWYHMHAHDSKLVHEERMFHFFLLLMDGPVALLLSERPHNVF